MLVVICSLLCSPGGAAAAGIGYGDQSNDCTVTMTPGSDSCGFSTLQEISPRALSRTPSSEAAWYVAAAAAEQSGDNSKASRTSRVHDQCTLPNRV